MQILTKMVASALLLLYLISTSASIATASLGFRPARLEKEQHDIEMKSMPISSILMAAPVEEEEEYPNWIE
ncbi:hypothetical protein AKJ16_DCAP10114 [Drosera capensis]